MPSIDDIMDRFAPIRVLPGYSHPSLMIAFNDLARTPYGRGVLSFCRDEKKIPLHVIDHIRPNVLGEATRHEIIVLERSESTTLAHEMRHVQQFHAMSEKEDKLVYNPLFNHITNRIIEADAFTFSCLHQITLWKENGFRNIGDIWRNEPALLDTEDKHTCMRAFRLACANQFDPAFMPRLMRRTFEHYYDSISLTAPSPGRHNYEDKAIEHAQRTYRAMDARLNTMFLERAAKHGITGLLGGASVVALGVGFWEVSALTLTGLGIKAVFDLYENADRQKMAEDLNTPIETLIDDLVEKIGPIRGMEGNYLTHPDDIKISDPYFTNLMLDERRAVHKKWQDRLVPAATRILNP